MEINNATDLKAAILELEDRKRREKELLVENFHAFKESLSPVNLIKSSFVKVRETPGLAGNILKASVGLGVGFLSKRLLIGKAPGLFKKIVGSAVEMGIAGLVAKNSDTIKSSGNRFFKNIFRSRK
ncbi:MAG: hypothetical protein H7Z13_13440 [Ferruginibacter sp.]|nr:hypothetical protein [Ferruginibacter sp.]